VSAPVRVPEYVNEVPVALVELTVRAGKRTVDASASRGVAKAVSEVAKTTAENRHGSSSFISRV
jgi:hypothetical protein